MSFGSRGKSRPNGEKRSKRTPRSRESSSNRQPRKTRVTLVMAAEVGAGEVLEDLETLRVESVADALEHQLALLGHAERGEAVQDGERLLAEHTLDGILERRLAAREAALKVGDALAQQCAGNALVVVEAGELFEFEHAPFVGVDAVDALELVIELVGEQLSTRSDEALEFPASGGVESHERGLLPADAKTRAGGEASFEFPQFGDEKVGVGFGGELAREAESDLLDRLRLRLLRPRAAAPVLWASPVRAPRLSRAPTRC